MKIFISGSEGLVGRHFQKRLEGHDLTCIDIKTGIDARDFFKKDDTKFDLAIHLAAIVGGRATIEGNPLQVATDLAIDSDAFQWALRTRPHHFVYYSSSAAYPTYLQDEYSIGFNYLNMSNGMMKFHTTEKYTNSYRLKEYDIDLQNISSPDLTYGWVKLTGEMLAQYALKEGLNVHVFRPFSGYAVDQDLDYPFPSFIKRALSRDNNFEIWGDGTQTRDWIHIDDVVNATVEAVQENITGPVNLCTGIPTNFNDLAMMMCKEIGYKPQLNHILTAPKGVHYRVGDPTNMNEFYQSKISLEEGIRKSLSVI